MLGENDELKPSGSDAAGLLADLLEGARRRNLSANSLERTWRAFLARATAAGLDPRALSGRLLGVGEITAHGLRHSAATILVNHVGKDLREIQELLRHKNIRTTVRYTHVGFEQTRQTAHAVLFKQFHFSNYLNKRDQYSPHIIGTAGNEVWKNGEWSLTLQGHDFGPTQLKGHWSSISVREGDTWKDRMLTFNAFPAPAATPSPTTTPSNQ